MIDIFIAYSHEDLGFKNELKKFLRPMLREERISIWDDFDIEAGQEWDAKIKERLYGAEVILLLVSADSLASDYFYGKEVKVSLERHAKGEAVVVPVVLRHCDWENTPLGGLEALPEKGRPVVDWPTRDQAWQDTVNRLRRVVESTENQRKKHTFLAEQQRRYQAATEAAGHLFGRQKWEESRISYADALALYQPGFSPEKSHITQQIADCDQQIRAEATRQSDLARQAETERQAAEPAERQRRQEEARRRQAEVEAEKRREREAARPAHQDNLVTNNNRLMLYGALGILTMALIIWLAVRPSPQASPLDQLPDTTETPAQLEDAAYQKALTVNTILALQSYLKLYPGGENAEQARQQLTRLQKQFDDFLNDADLVMDDDRTTACGYLQKALVLSPGDSGVVKKLEKLKCK